jgi:hypothetical protein
MQSSSTAVVVYERQPQLIFSAGQAGDLCRFDPYALLCIPPETAAEVHALSKASQAKINGRSARIRSAYLELAARFHPDTARGDANGAALRPMRAQRSTPLWISDMDCFAHIAVAYRLLLDLEQTVQYHLAAARVAPGDQQDDANCEVRRRC